MSQKAKEQSRDAPTPQVSFQPSSDAEPGWFGGPGSFSTRVAHARVAEKKRGGGGHWAYFRWWVSQQVVAAGKQIRAEVVAVEGGGMESTEGVQVP